MLMISSSNNNKICLVRSKSNTPNYFCVSPPALRPAYHTRHMGALPQLELPSRLGFF